MTNSEPSPSSSASPPRLTYRFGNCLLDARRRVLFVGLRERSLPEKPFGILSLLLEADGRTVTKDEFFARVWPNDHVSEANLTQQVCTLRAWLGDGAPDSGYIITVAGRGYRLAVPVERKLGLSMKQRCERCAQSLGPGAVATICSYECTFCIACASALGGTCPNCGGELLQRPRRATPSVALSSQR